MDSIQFLKANLDIFQYTTDTDQEFEIKGDEFHWKIIRIYMTSVGYWKISSFFLSYFQWDLFNIRFKSYLFNEDFFSIDPTSLN